MNNKIEKLFYIYLDVFGVLKNSLSDANEEDKKNIIYQMKVIKSLLCGLAIVLDKKVIQDKVYQNIKNMLEDKPVEYNTLNDSDVVDFEVYE